MRWKFGIFAGIAVSVIGCGDEKYCVGPVGNNCSFAPVSSTDSVGGKVRFKTDEIRKLKPGEAYTFKAIGGYPPYKYSVQSGGGDIDEETGAFVAPATVGTTVIKVTDRTSDNKQNSEIVSIVIAKE